MSLIVLFIEDLKKRGVLTRVLDEVEKGLEKGPEDPQTPPVPQDEDEREPMFVQEQDHDYVPEPIYPEYIPLEDEHEFSAEEQPILPVDSPTAESPGYVTESDPEEDPEEYEDDKTEDGPVDYPMDMGDDGEDGPVDYHMLFMSKRFIFNDIMIIFMVTKIPNRLIEAIATSQNIPKTPDRRLLELEDQINFLLKGPQPAPRVSSTHVHQAYTEAVSLNSHPRKLDEPPRHNSFTFRERIRPNPQPQALGTNFKARVRDYMATHTKRMERFENVIFKQREEINDRMTEMFGLLKELTASRTLEKVLIREEARHPITKNVNSISLIKGEEEKSAKDNAMSGDSIEKPDGSDAVMPLKEVKKENEAENRTKNEPVKIAKKKLTRIKEEESMEAPSFQSVGYYLKHKINKKLVEGLIENKRFNDSLSATRVGKMKHKTYNLLSKGPIHDAILKKKITKKEDIGGNFEIPCNIGGLKQMDAQVDQGSEVNGMPLSIYKRLTDERPAKTDIRLSLVSHSYIYPLGIDEDVLVDVAGYVYPVDFFDKGTITLRSGKSNISFHRIPETLCGIKKGTKNNIEPIAPTMTVNRLVLEREERIKLHQEKEMKFDQWRSKIFDNERPAPVKEEFEVKDEGGVM
ncbi:hypothetical protein Tco_1403209 [Tanacetum coccineum]